MFSLMIKFEDSEKWEQHYIDAKSLETAIKKLRKKLKKSFEVVAFQDLNPRG